MKQNITERCNKKPTKHSKKFGDNTGSKKSKISSKFQSKTNDSVSKNDKTAIPKEIVFILGDSIKKKVNGFLLTRNINHNSLLNNLVKLTLQDFNPEHIILHIGTNRDLEERSPFQITSTNDLNTERTARQVGKSITDVCQSLKPEAHTVTVSLIVSRYDNLDNKANEVKGRLINMCKERNIPYSDHADTISPERHLNESNLHLNRYGILAFA